MSFLRSCLAVSTAMSAVALPNVVLAQGVDVSPAGEPAVEPTAASSGAIGQIVVTANKRSEDVQDVPISITAYSGDQLNALGITDTTSITEQIPALRVNQWSPSLTIFSLRGVSQSNFTDNLEAPVAVYFDNAYMGSINGISGQLFDVERVEVLRGPQGTLFGRNATGGLIHYLSRKADRDTANGYIEAGYGSFDDIFVEAAIGGAIADGLRVRAAGRFEQADGYVISTDTDALAGLVGSGQDLGGKNGWAGRITAQWDVSADLQVNLWYKHAEDNDLDTGGYVFDNCEFLANGYCSVDSLGLTNSQNGVINGITGEPASPFENFGDRRGFLDRTVDIYQADIEADLGDVTVTSVTNYTDLYKSYGEDGDAIPVLVINFDNTNSYEQFSQELRFSGDSDFMNWQVGAYYLDIDMLGTIMLQGAPVLGLALDVNGDAVDPVINQTYAIGAENWSIFGQADFFLTDDLTFTAGLRYSQDNKEIDYLAVLSDPAVAPDFTTGSSTAFEGVVPGVNEIDYGDWAARAVLSYEPNSDLLLFASWNRGIKGGNWSLGADVTATEFQHSAETLNSFEAGFKSTLTDGTLRLNGTLFHYQYDDYQAFALTSAVPFVSNSDAHATGAELEAYWSPSPRFDAVFGAAWQTSSVDQVNGVGEQVGPEFFPGAPDAEFCTNQGGFFFCDYPTDMITDAEFPNAPQFSFNYLLRYNVDVLAGNLAAQVDGAWYDDQYLEVTNGLSSLQPAYNVTNASLRYEDDKSGISLQGWVKNVFDKAYRAYTLNLGILGTTSFFAPPRTYGVTMRVPFGS